MADVLQATLRDYHRTVLRYILKGGQHTFYLCPVSVGPPYRIVSHFQNGTLIWQVGNDIGDDPITVVYDQRWQSAYEAKKAIATILEASVGLHADKLVYKLATPYGTYVITKDEVLGGDEWWLENGGVGEDYPTLRAVIAAVNDDLLRQQLSPMARWRWKRQHR